MTGIFIVDIIDEVVQATSDKVLSIIKANEAAVLGAASPMQSLSYSYGHYNELTEELIQEDQSQEERFNKYPRIWLRTDFRERRGQQPGIYAEVFLNVIIMHHTDRNYKSTQRKANVFEPVLYPIYYEFVNQLYQHPLIHVISDEMIPHDKYDRYYWGNTKQGKTNDFVDGIELDNLQLKINFENCPS